MTARPFLDTNLLVYASLEVASSQAHARVDRAQAILTGGGIVSVQVLNEFVDVARRKFNHPWAKVQQLLYAVELCCGEAQPLSAILQAHAVALAARYGLRIYDAAIIASAIEAGCTSLYTEDLQHGQQIEGLRIENPFLSA
ncbi:MAG TPA: PIN domain-containing protein [Terracidiphilus sp.]|jgi:predicted nucleic acid-binding protein|nr:PIN domain-containing protein [Terracidiphilus sp.]